MRYDITERLKSSRDPQTIKGVFFDDIRSGIFAVDAKGFDVGFIDNNGILHGFRGDVIDGELILTEDSQNS